MNRKRIVGAAVLALLIAGAQGSAFAETDIVLSNESEGTEVNTGDSVFNNNSNESSTSAGFSTSANAFPAPAPAPAAAAAPVTQSAPAASSAESPETAVSSADSDAIDGLFVGFAPSFGFVL